MLVLPEEMTSWFLLHKVLDFVNWHKVLPKKEVYHFSSLQLTLGERLLKISVINVHTLGRCPTRSSFICKAVTILYTKFSSVLFRRDKGGLPFLQLLVNFMRTIIKDTCHQCTLPRTLPTRITIYMYMISRYCWPVRIGWAIFISFFIKKYQKILNFNYITCKGINLLFITPASLLSPGRLLITYWPWPSGICDKCYSEFWYSFTFKVFLKPSMQPTVVGCFPAEDFFCPWGPCNNVFRLGKTMGRWTDIESNAECQGWVCHAGDKIVRRNWSFLTLASTFPIKQNEGNAYP